LASFLVVINHVEFKLCAIKTPFSEGLGRKYDQNTLYSCMKRYYETHLKSCKKDKTKASEIKKTVINIVKIIKVY
jgi:hypothetical protein